MTDSYKHVAEITSRFKKSIKTLDKGVKEQLFIRIEELLNGQLSGKSLKGPYRELKAIRAGKYRLIYSDKELCKIVLYDVRHRETAYMS